MKVGAFTIAEVLITLGIIGVVAAMTLPALITRNQNKALEASLKKNYSIILQAFDMYQADNGYRLKASDVNTIGCKNTKMCLKTRISSYFKILRDCGYGGNVSTACIPYKGNDNIDDESNSKIYKSFNNTKISNLSYFDDGQFVLSDGSLILIENPTGLERVYITVDVNGYLKNPNRWGHDLFTFQLMNDGRILPMGAPDTTFTDKNTYCSATSSDQYNGIACTYYALSDKNYFNNLPR